jgi:hypothetical protein
VVVCRQGGRGQVKKTESLKNLEEKMQEKANISQK